MYKLTLYPTAPLCYIDRPILDSMLAYCWMKRKYPEGVPQPVQVSEDQIETFDDLPLHRHPDGWFYASVMHYDPERHVAYTGTWQKRWHQRNDRSVAFKGASKRVAVTSGPFKSYSTPIQLHQHDRVWWYFDGEPTGVGQLITAYLMGVGKKISQGYGFFDRSRIEIKKIGYNPFDKPIRPIPATPDDILKNAGLPFQYRAWRPPYHNTHNMTLCWPVDFYNTGTEDTP